MTQLKPFSAENFIGKGWSIESDTNMTEVDLSNIELRSFLHVGEDSVTGEEVLKRSKEDGATLLSANVFEYLYNNQEKIPERWKDRVVFFDGTTLRRPRGYRYALCLYWLGDRWFWDCYWLGGGRSAGSPSAVLASTSHLDTQPSSKPVPLEARVERLENVLQEIKRILTDL